MNTGYKQSQLEYIPGHWTTSTIEKEASIITGGKDTQDKNDDGIYPFFVRSNTIERINSYSFEGEAVLTSGDGVGVGKIYHYLNCKFDYHQRVYNIHNFSNNLNGRFFYYFFSSHFYQRVMRLSAKNSVDSVRRNMIAEMEIPLPPLPEQQKIAEILSTIDAKIEVIDQQISETQALRKGLMQQLLSKGIGHTEFKDSALGQIPKSWEVRILKEECDKLNVGFVGTCEKFYCEKEEGVQMIRTGNLSNGKIKYDNLKYVTHEFHQKNSKSQIFKGDLLIARHGSSGQAVLVPKNFNKSNCLNIIVIRPKPSLNSEFLKFQFNSKVIKEQVRKKTAGSTQGVVNTKEIASLNFLYPPLSEQYEIAKILRSVDDKLDLLSEKKSHFQELKQGLMQQLLTGKIRV